MRIRRDESCKATSKTLPINFSPGKTASASRKSAPTSSSADGESVRSMLEKGGFEDALRRGDAGALKNAVADIMKTDSGARLVRQLQALMGNK